MVVVVVVVVVIVVLGVLVVVVAPSAAGERRRAHCFLSLCLCVLWVCSVLLFVFLCFGDFLFYVSGCLYSLFSFFRVF